MRRSRHQLTISDAISTSFVVLFKNFVPFMFLGAIFTSPNLIMTFNPSQDPGLMDTLVSYAISTACSLMLTGTLVYGVYSTLRGQNASMIDCLSVGVSKMLPAVGVMIVTGLGIALGLLLLIIPGIVLMLRWYVAVPCAVLERTGVSESMARSKYLTRGHQGTIFWLLCVIGLLATIVAIPLTMVLGLPHEYVFDAQGEVVLQTRNGAILGFFAFQVFMGVLSACTSAVVYQSLRIQKEGTDLESIAAVFD